MTIKITISYDGSKYYGSQIQNSKNTVHGQFSNVFKTLGIYSKISFSGRTDKNVHASMQVLSLNLPYYWTNLHKLENLLKSYLPTSIKIKSLKEVPNTFHARFSAKKRSYRYIISKKPLTAFNSSYMAYYTNINESLINKACQEFIGIHDFEFFHKKGSEPISTIREIFDIKFYSYRDIWVFKFTANSYLRSQIRIIVNFLLEVSANNLSIHDIKIQLLKQKMINNNLASASGLYLSHIYYAK